MVFSYFGVWLPPKPSRALCSWNRKPPGEVEFRESEGGRGQLARGVPTSVGGRGTICPLPAVVRLEQLEPMWELHCFPHSQTAPFAAKFNARLGLRVERCVLGEGDTAGLHEGPGSSAWEASLEWREAPATFVTLTSNPLRSPILDHPFSSPGTSCF